MPIQKPRGYFLQTKSVAVFILSVDVLCVCITLVCMVYLLMWYVCITGVYHSAVYHSGVCGASASVDVLCVYHCGVLCVYHSGVYHSGVCHWCVWCDMCVYHSGVLCVCITVVCMVPQLYICVLGQGWQPIHTYMCNSGVRLVLGDQANKVQIGFTRSYFWVKRVWEHTK